MTVPRQGVLVYVVNAADIGGGGGTGVSSLNALTGAVVATTPNSTLNIGTSGQDVTFDIDLATANLWAAAQTFPSSDLLIQNPAATHAYTLAGAAITAARTLTLPLTTGADTLAALGVAQTWPAAQTIPAPVTILSTGSPYTVVGSDEVILVTTGGSGYTVDLPAANAVIGRKLLIIKADSGAGAVTVSRAGSDTIEGATSKTVSSQYGKVGLVSTGGSVWYDLGSGGV